MPSDAQRMVDMFLAAGTPRHAARFLSSGEAMFKSVEGQAEARRPFSIFAVDDEERAAHLASQMSEVAAGMANASEADMIERILSLGLAAGLSGFPCAAGRLIIRPPWL